MREAIFADIAALKLRVPGLLSVRAGANVSPEGLDKGFHEGFIVDFVDGDARDRYLADEAHAAVGGRIVEAAQGGLDGVFVFDLEIAD